MVSTLGLYLSAGPEFADARFRVDYSPVSSSAGPQLPKVSTELKAPFNICPCSNTALLDGVEDLQIVAKEETPFQLPYQQAVATFYAVAGLCTPALVPWNG